MRVRVRACVRVHVALASDHEFASNNFAQTRTYRRVHDDVLIRFNMVCVRARVCMCVIAYI